MLDMPLGTLIFRAGLIAPQQLEDALAEGLRSGKRLGEVLLSRGWLSEEDLSRLLAGQKGLPYADLEKIAIDRELAQAMNYDDARSEMALPVVTEFGLPVVAMADPDEAAMERLRAQLGPEVRFVVGAPSVLAHLIDEVLGGAPAPGLLVTPVADEQYASTESIAADQYPSDEPPPAEPVPLETAVEPEPSPPEPKVLDVSDQEAPAPAPDVAGQEVRPIIAEGEVDYPTFSEYQPIPEAETIGGPDEQLPAEVQSGEYGYYDDPSLLEGNAWQAGETGPPAADTNPGADQYDTGQPLEETEQPFAEAEAPPEQAREEPIQEPPPEGVSETVVPDVEEPALEQAPELPEEVAGAPSGEEDPTATTPAWMRGEVNVITADVVDFIESGAPDAPETSSVGNSETAEGETGPVTGEDESPVEVAPPLEDATDAEAVESAPSEPTAEELGVEPPSWASEPNEVAEEVAAEATADVPPESAAAEEVSAPQSNRGEFELVLRLVDGDRVPIGSFTSVDEAQVKAAEVVKQFAEIEEGSWPFVGGRFLRPETIVSIDVEQQQQGSDWGGSNSRGRMFSGDESE